MMWGGGGFWYRRKSYQQDVDKFLVMVVVFRLYSVVDFGYGCDRVGCVFSCGVVCSRLR